MIITHIRRLRIEQVDVYNLKLDAIQIKSILLSLRRYNEIMRKSHNERFITNTAMHADLKQGQVI